MTKEKKILLIIFVNLIIIIAEIAFGLISNSFALIADALHNTGDVLAVIVTYIAIKFATKTSTFKQTYGYLKAEMMAAFVNTLFLNITMLYMIYEAIYRFIYPEIINPTYMMIVGTIAIIANGLSAYVLHGLGIETCNHEHSHKRENQHHHHHHEHNDANIHSAYLHMLGDALISVAVVCAGVFIYFFKIYYIDSILTILFSLYILFHSYGLLKKSFLSLMDINIIKLKKETIDEIILSDKKVKSYHDLHITKPSSKQSFISFHIVLTDKNLKLFEIEDIVENIKSKLSQHHFNHSVIQVDSLKWHKESNFCSL